MSNTHEFKDRSSDRRFAKRYESDTLVIELQTKNWLGAFKPAININLNDFSLGGISFSSALKIKKPQVLINIYSEYHNLKNIPAEIVRQEEHGLEFQYALRFRLGFLPQSASRNTFAILKHIETSAKKSAVAA